MYEFVIQVSFHPFGAKERHDVKSHPETSFSPTCGTTEVLHQTCHRSVLFFEHSASGICMYECVIQVFGLQKSAMR